MIIGFIQQKASKKSSLGDLLIQFFGYYGIEFNYKDKGISITNECLYDKESRGWFRPKQPYMLSIEDPNNKDNVSLIIFFVDFINTLVINISIVMSIGCY